MDGSLWQAVSELTLQHQVFFALALLVAFAFEFINGFHDTANAVTTVIYTGTLRATPAVLYSGFCNFLGVLLGGTAVAFAIVNLLPVDLLVESSSMRSIVMVLSLLLAGVIWNLGTWWYGLPVSSSHTLIGSILGVGLANSLLTRGDANGINWGKATDVGLSLLISPAIGFLAAALLLLVMKRIFTNPNLYHPPGEGDNPPRWIRWTLLGTCGGVSFAHGSNDGQKGMGLILLVLIGFLPSYFSLNDHHPELAREVRQSAVEVGTILEKEAPALAVLTYSDIKTIESIIGTRQSFNEIGSEERWELRRAIVRLRQTIAGAELGGVTRTALAAHTGSLKHSVEFVPLWVVIGVALALGIGTTVGYKRIVVTVAEKIGNSHLTYAQGAAAEVVAAATIGLADAYHLPVSTTQVLSSGVAGTMWANRSGVQRDTVRRIGLAWLMTMPASILLSATLFWTGGYLLNSAVPQVSHETPVSAPIEAEPAGQVIDLPEPSLKAVGSAPSSSRDNPVERSLHRT